MVETIDYFLKRYREDRMRIAEKRKRIDEQVAEYERELHQELAAVV